VCVCVWRIRKGSAIESSDEEDMFVTGEWERKWLQESSV